jgi:enoyl-CoA hydratase/carnithine racemase
MTDLVRLEVEQGVALVTLNRPDHMNAINTPMGEALDAAMVDAALDPSVRVIVITGAGERAFCAGADMQRLEGLKDGAESLSTAPAPGARPLERLTSAPAHLRTRYTAPMAVDQPVIAAINGACAGIGLTLAANCDLRFASRKALFAASFALRGLTAEGGLAKSLAALVGRGAAADMLLSGRKVQAEEAFSLGLADRLFEPEDLVDRTLDYARAIARDASPRSTRVIKRQLQAAQDQTFEGALMRSREETEASILSEDFREGVTSFKERRPPQFVGR